MQLSQERDDLLPEFSKRTLRDRYVLPNETYQEAFARVARAFADSEEHAQRMYDYHSKLWFMSATPVLTNGGTDRGLPISCYLHSLEDSLDSIIENFVEGAYLGAGGGGLGTGWSKLRSIGEAVRGRGHSSGIIPFIKIFDSGVLAISQGSLRRGSEAEYLDISHPEIEEFLEIRKPSGDFNRKSLNIHHGVVIPDAFMHAVRDNALWSLVDPKSKEVKRQVNARALFQKILELRMQTGEPYILFKDNANRGMPEWSRKLGLEVTMSNLCIEIMQHTGLDYLNAKRTAVCCLGSVNMETYDEWKGNEQFLEDCWRYLDNVIQTFIDRTDGLKGFSAARYSAQMQRSVGLGLMGFHSYLQKNNVPIESAMAKSINLQVWKWMHEVGQKVNLKLSQEKGPCTDAVHAKVEARFSHMFALAPTASISIIAASCSPGCDPITANLFTHKTLSGNFEVKNRYLQRELAALGLDIEEIWDSILEHNGSVQHLTIPQHLKDVFKTADEIDQRWIIEFAADRTPYIDQGQSTNLFLPAEVDKYDLMMVHFKAWEKGLKSLYYLRSKSVQRAGFVGGVEKDNTLERKQVFAERKDYEECLACQ